MLKLFFYVWLSVPTLFSHTAVWDLIESHPAMSSCNHTWATFTTSAKYKGTQHKITIKGIHIPGKSSKVIYLTGSIHGDEKAGAVMATNLILNLCMLQNEQQFSAFIIPVANPVGFDRKRYGRGGLRYKDLNRDAFNKDQPESHILARPFKIYNVVRYIDVHMTGNVVLLPRPWSKAYKSSKRFYRRLRALGLLWGSRDGHPNGMLYTAASEMGIPSILIEIGGRRGDHRIYRRGHYFRLVHKPLLATFRLFNARSLNTPTDTRPGVCRKRVVKLEGWRRRSKRWSWHYRSHLRAILRGKPGPVYRVGVAFSSKRAIVSHRGR